MRRPLSDSPELSTRINRTKRFDRKSDELVVKYLSAGVIAQWKKLLAYWYASPSMYKALRILGWDAAAKMPE